MRLCVHLVGLGVHLIGLCPSGRGIDPFKGAEATLGKTVCLLGRTEGPDDGTVCPSGKGVDPFKGAEATLGRTMCLPGGTGYPPSWTVCPLFRAGSSAGAVCTRRRARCPKETVCPLFAVKQPVQAVLKKNNDTLPLFYRARSGLYSNQVGVGGLNSGVSTKMASVRVSAVPGGCLRRLSVVTFLLDRIPYF